MRRRVVRGPTQFEAQCLSSVHRMCGSDATTPEWMAEGAGANRPRGRCLARCGLCSVNRCHISRSTDQFGHGTSNMSARQFPVDSAWAWQPTRNMNCPLDSAKSVPQPQRARPFLTGRARQVRQPARSHYCRGVHCTAVGQASRTVARELPNLQFSSADFSGFALSHAPSHEVAS